MGVDVASSTGRKLFTEQAGGMAYAIAKQFVQIIYALFTPANYNGYSRRKRGEGSECLSRHLELTRRFRAVNPDQARDRFSRPNEVPEENRCILLNSAYYNQLSNDPSITEFFCGTPGRGNHYRRHHFPYSWDSCR